MKSILERLRAKSFTIRFMGGRTLEMTVGDKFTYEDDSIGKYEGKVIDMVDNKIYYLWCGAKHNGTLINWTPIKIIK